LRFLKPTGVDQAPARRGRRQLTFRHIGVRPSAGIHGSLLSGIESRALVSCHRRCLLLPRRTSSCYFDKTAAIAGPGDLISLALTFYERYEAHHQDLVVPLMSSDFAAGFGAPAANGPPVATYPVV
jgi:hypothetical protein